MNRSTRLIAAAAGVYISGLSGLFGSNKLYLHVDEKNITAIYRVTMVADVNSPACIKIMEYPKYGVFHHFTVVTKARTTNEQTYISWRPNKVYLNDREIHYYHGEDITNENYKQQMVNLRE
jgi:hypothetical protein